MKIIQKGTVHMQLITIDFHSTTCIT